MILTTKQAAEILKITHARVRQLIDKGRLPATKFANAWMIKKKDLEKVKDRKPGRPKKCSQARQHAPKRTTLAPAREVTTGRKRGDQGWN